MFRQSGKKGRSYRLSVIYDVYASHLVYPDKRIDDKGFLLKLLAFFVV